MGEVVATTVFILNRSPTRSDKGKDGIHAKVDWIVVVRHKAWIVTIHQGVHPATKVDYNEGFVPIAQMESVHMLLAVVAQKGWLVLQMDVKSTFLVGKLKEEVYVQQLSGFVVVGHEAKVIRLKAMYSLHQVLHAWNTKLDNNLCKLGFTTCQRAWDVHQGCRNITCGCQGQSSLEQVRRKSMHSRSRCVVHSR